MPKLTVHRDLASLAALAPAWRDLQRRGAFPSITTTPTWLTTWWEVYGASEERELCCLAVEEGGELVGLAPLLRRPYPYLPGSGPAQKVIRRQRIELLATGEPEADETCSPYVGILAAAGSEQRVATTIARHLVDAVQSGKTVDIPTWDELRLTAMREDDPMIAALAKALGDLGVETSLDHVGTSSLTALPATWDAYLEPLSKNRRYFLRRSQRDFEKWCGDAGFQMRAVSSADELPEAQKTLYRLHEERWKAEGKSGVFSSSRFRLFHERIMARLIEDQSDGELELLLLEANGRPVAALHNFRFDGRVYFYQSGRTMDLPTKVRVGIVSHLLAMQRAIADGMREYDFLEGGQAYKAQLAPSERKHMALSATAPTMRGRVHRRIEDLANAGRRHLRDYLRRRSQ